MKNRSLYIKLVFLCVFSFFITNVHCFQTKDSLTKNVAILVEKLDTITKLDTTIELNNSIRFDVFKNIYKIAKPNDWIYLIKNHSNPVVKGYAYIALLIDENKQADAIYIKNFKKVKIKISDVVRVYRTNQANEFIAFIYPKRKRIKISMQKNKIDLVDDSEPDVILKENELKREQ